MDEKDLKIKNLEEDLKESQGRCEELLKRSIAAESRVRELERLCDRYLNIIESIAVK